MEEQTCSLSARSRKPLNETGALWWNTFGSDQGEVKALTDPGSRLGKVDKSTNTNLQRKVSLPVNMKLTAKSNLATYFDKTTKENLSKILKQEQARPNYEAAKKTLIDSLKIKFSPNDTSSIDKKQPPRTTNYEYESLSNGNAGSTINGNTETDSQSKTSSIEPAHKVNNLTSDDTSSDRHAKRFEESGHGVRLTCEEAQGIWDSMSVGRRVDIWSSRLASSSKGVSHASGPREPGRALVLPRRAVPSRAAGAEGGRLQHTRSTGIRMPLPAREGLSTPRSARAPIVRRSSNTFPHQRLKKEKVPDSPPEMDSPVGGGGDLRRQNEELRARLAGEAADHRRRLDAYRRAQQSQAALVSRLQSKVVQYKQRCSELETQMIETTPRPEPSLYRLSEAITSKAMIALPAPSALPSSSGDSICDNRINDLDTALRRLEEEKRKCEKLFTQNGELREQLEESHQLNEALTNDLQKLTNDWEALRDEVAIKEDEWKDEEQAFNDYYASEHGRLLGLWREVVSVKRHFADLQTSTERDLYRVKNDLDSAARDLVGTLSGYSLSVSAQGLKPAPPAEAGAPSPGATLESLRVALRDAGGQRDAALADLRERDARIQRLLAELQGLEERCDRAECLAEASHVTRSALEEIARALIHDSEDAPAAAAAAVMHADRSPSRAGGNPTAFAESTISAVQAALHKYQIQIHELQVKLQSAREQLSASRRQADAADAAAAALDAKVHDLQAKLDQANADVNQLQQEKESLLKTTAGLRADKTNLERSRLEINAMVESLSSDYEKLQKVNARCEKLIESLEGEKSSLQDELDHMQREAATREGVLRAEEERASTLRGELVAAREALHAAELARELLLQQKAEGDAAVDRIEAHRNELEVELERAVAERDELHELAARLEAAVRSLEQDRDKLVEENKELTAEKASLSSHSSSQASDMAALRKEVLSLEQLKLQLQSDKAAWQDKCTALELHREELQTEIAQAASERSELASQADGAARRSDALNEELIRAQQRLEQCAETVARLNRALEDRAKDAEDRQMTISSLEKERASCQEQLCSARGEREALEAALFDTTTLLEDAECCKKKLQHELCEAEKTHEKYKGQISRLTKELESAERKCRETRSSLQQSAGKLEAESRQQLANVARQAQENITKLKEEKEQLRQSLEQKLSQTVNTLTSEKELCDASWREREKKLLANRDACALQHEEAMLRAENDKQQALLMAHQEHQALAERLDEARRQADALHAKLERARREAAARADHDRAAGGQLKEEIAGLKTRLEEARAAYEDERARLETRIKELLGEREASARDAAELRAQLALAEDRLDASAAQLTDTMRKMKELENESESLRKELTDARRQLSAAAAERDKYQASARDLREHVKRAEAERREAARALDEAYHKIAGLEENRTALEMERSRLQAALRDAATGGEHAHKQLKTVENQLKRERAALEQTQHDVKELQSRLQNESEERERCAADAGAARRLGAELESALAAARGELGGARARAAQLEAACRAQQQEMVIRLEDSRAKERRLEELKHNLEVCLADAAQQIQELKTRLGAAEGRTRALDAALASCEATKREVETKLCSIASALRRVCGVGGEGRRLASPARRYGHKGRADRDPSEERGDAADVDPDALRKGMKQMMHEVCQLEREKDDFKAQAASLRKQLKEAGEQKGAGEGRAHAAAAALRSAQDDKARLSQLVAQRDAVIQGLNESVAAQTAETSSLRDRITSLEAALTSLNEDKTQLENKAESLRSQLEARAAEAAALREGLAAQESRAARLDVRRAQLEGDLQRCAHAQRDQLHKTEKLKEHCDNYARTVASLEDRCTSLKGTVEQLSTALQKAAAAESELRAELAKLQRQLNDAKSGENSAAEKLRHIQKSLTTCENEKRVLSEKLDSAKTALIEMKRINATLEDQAHRLNNQLANVEVQRSGLESQLRMTTWNGKDNSDSELERELHALERERNELRARCGALEETVRKCDAERRRTGYRSKSIDRVERSVYYSDLDSGADSGKDSSRLKETRSVYTGMSCMKDNKSFSAELALLEIENRELKMKIKRLEKELADKESELAVARAGAAAAAAGGPLDGDAARLQRLVSARDAAHRDHVARLEQQAKQLRQQLSAEIRHRQAYVTRSGRAARDVQRLRSALGDSLRTVAQDPSLDSYTLEHEARKLDSTLAHSLPPLTDSDYSK